MSHALLSPSSASRWLACTPSARLEAEFPDTAATAAAEGTLAHALGEAKIRLAAKMISKAEFNRIHKQIQADKLYGGAEMEDHTDEYCAFVMERYAEAQSRTADAKLFVETRLDMSRWVPEGFGTADVVIVADHVADFVDLKYGKGVEVSAVENRQMMLYGLGVLDLFDIQFDIARVRMTIYQPRIGNISEWDMASEDLAAWAATELEPAAKLAFAGEGEYKPGKHCQFCRARVSCRAHAEHQLEIARHDFKAPALIGDEDISDILSRAASFKSWVKEVEDYALEQAVNNGKRWPGFKLVEGRSNRMYKDPEQVASKLLAAGFKPEMVYEPQTLFGITAMEKNIGKKTFAELLEGLIIKPTGKPTLASADDKRPEWQADKSPENDFAEDINTD